MQFQIFPGVETQRNVQPPLRSWLIICDMYPQLKLRAIIGISRWDGQNGFVSAMKVTLGFYPKTCRNRI
jgi:hypothetical protein